MNAPASLHTLVRLRAIQRRLRALVEDLDDARYRTQYHPDLSPLGWHLGHCAFIENYWLREVVQGDDRSTRDLREFYMPETSPKPERGPALPPLPELLEIVTRSQSDNVLLLSGAGDEALRPHPLLEDEYLSKFLVQHHCQHAETMAMVRTQQVLQAHDNGYEPRRRLEAWPLDTERRQIPAGNYRIGGERPWAFDNELPEHRVETSGFEIAPYPITNAQWLCFIEDDGYHRCRYWGEQGWEWRQRLNASCPDHWRRDAQGAWHGVGPTGPCELAPGDPVHGICHHEAQAFAAWAGARLPHEYEWEIACRTGLLEGSGRAWEWCSNTFHPYAGFEAFPYKEYSTPWYDGGHYTLRGGSRYTQRDVRRASFRNFYTPDKRHIFAGLRLAF